jgi:endonuclease YncB( thermonuclease family)
MKKILILILISLFCYVGTGFAVDMLPDCADICKITRVIDGDTVVCDCVFRKQVKVRLNTLDSFESKKFRRAYKQAKKYGITIDEVVERGQQAKEITKELILNKQVALVFHERKYGMYGRLLADIYFVKDGNWTNLNDYLLAEHSDIFFLYGN